MLKDLKSKLPSKKKSEEVEDDELQDDVTHPTRQADTSGVTDISDEEDFEEEAPQSLVDKIKAQFSKSSKAKKSQDDDEEEDEEEEKKPKKKLSPIHIIAILALVYFAADEFLIPKEDAPSSEAQVSSAEEAIKKKAEERRKAKEAAAAAAAKAKEEGNVEPPSIVEDPATPTPDIAVEPESTPTDIPVDEAPMITDTPVPSIEEPVMPEPSIPETTVETPVTPQPSDTGITDSNDTIDGGMIADEDDENNNNLTDKILQDLEKQANNSEVKTTKKEYVAPPDYEYKGRGLVYNCVGKHWACVDAPSYKSCEDNSASTKTLGKSKECYPFNIYEDSKGCANVQNRMVSSSAKTNFCNE